MEQNYGRFLTSTITKIPGSIHTEIKNLVVNDTPLIHNLSFGIPNPETFPLHKATVTLKDGSKFDISPKEMTETLQYNKINGYPPLVKHLKHLIQHLHNPPKWSDREVMVTNGSLEGLGRVFEIILDNGDFVIIPEHCYQGVFVTTKHIQPNYITVKSDHDGLIVECLQDAILNCRSKGGSPKALYINPCGCNPTGTVLSESRKGLIYELACKYDFLILEDDPYSYLDYSEEPTVSFLQLDTEGRVIRLESFSKTVSAGLRLGFIIAPKPLVYVMGNITSTTTIHTSMLPQMMISRLFDTWGIDGFLKKTKITRDFYRNQRDVMLKAADKHLKGLCEWTVPSGGFFLWLKVPQIEDTETFFLEYGLERGVACSPGTCFSSDPSIPSQYIRVSYSTTNEEDMDKGFRILADAIREVIKLEE